MNNSQFRRLLDIPASSTQSKQNGNPARTPRREGLLASSLGSRMRSSIPMTPRSIAISGGVDFARQLAERDASLDPANTKKFRSTPVPKGTKLAPGYQDRTQLRTSTEEDDKASRIKALEEMVKLGQMDIATFESLRDKIVGEDLRDAHLVKGLDWKLLERARKGEVTAAELLEPGTTRKEVEDSPVAKAEEELEDEFEKLEEQDIQPLKKDAKVKKGEMAPPPTVAGKKRNRDEILRELKANRLAALEKARQPSLGPKFTKVGRAKETSRVEKDERGREILITVDENGKVKRKVKRAKVDEESSMSELLMPDKEAKPLGMEVVPIVAQAPGDDGSGDIFDGVGGDYNPLEGIEEEDDSDTSDDIGKISEKDDITKPSIPSRNNEHDSRSQEPVPQDEPKPHPDAPQLSNEQISRPKNYFNDRKTSTSSTFSGPSNSNSLSDPTILAALKKASTIAPILNPSASTDEEAAKKMARHKKMLEMHDRDEDDMDLGFGGSRFDDAEDGEDTRVKLSVWGDDVDEEGGGGKGNGGGGGGGGGGKRKRAPKKRKGDANSAADVLKVIERRKGEVK